MATGRRILVSVLIAGTVMASGCAIPNVPATPPVPTLPTTATAGNATIVAVGPPAQPCCPKQTLPQWLGITGLVKGIGGLLGRVRSRLGSRFPGLEAKPELLPITDPANANSDNPAVAEAAAVKGEEDAAAQKAKAIRYLGTIGCGGCYPEVEQAILAALDDCTEVVRYEAVKALRSTAGQPCCLCKADSCCGPDVMKKLRSIAFDTDGKGCFKEDSPRVRRNARLAIAACGSPPALAEPTEGPSSGEEPTPAAASAGAEAGAAAPAAEAPPAEGGAPPAAEGAPAGAPAELPAPAPAAAAQTAPSARVSLASQATTSGCNCGHAHAPPVVMTLTPTPAAAPAASAANNAPATVETAPPDNLPTTPNTAAVIARPVSYEAPCPPREVLARVNGEPLTLDDLGPDIEIEMERRARQIPPAGRADARRALLAGELQALVDRKLLCQAARKAEAAAPPLKPRSQAPAGRRGDWRQLAALPELSPAEERELAALWLDESSRVDTQVTEAELTARLAARADELAEPAQMRWEQITLVPAARLTPAQARAALERLRESLSLTGNPLTAAERQVLDCRQLPWTVSDEVESRVIATALTRLPVGAVSPVLDDNGHPTVVRVLERRAARVPLLAEVADELRAEIVRERRERRRQVYMNWLREQAQVSYEE